jgi:UDP-N-acetylglucosamine 2-epimerase (non-hydrolysing)
MPPDQALTDLTARVLIDSRKAFAEIKPDLLLVQGDTTTVFAAFYFRIRVGHVEAGLCSHDLYNPFPEELNRRLTGLVTDLYFPPTLLARNNLLQESGRLEQIVVTGKTVIDALYSLLNRPYSLAEAIKDLVGRFPDPQVVYPMHLLDPLNYLNFINLMQRSCVILTDSGGVQEEAPSLHKPLLVIRRVTERPEAFEARLSRAIGNARENIVSEVSRLLMDKEAYQAMSTGANPYGDGHASERIAKAVVNWARKKPAQLSEDSQFKPRYIPKRLHAGRPLI